MVAEVAVTEAGFLPTHPLPLGVQLADILGLAALASVAPAPSVAVPVRAGLVAVAAYLQSAAPTPKVAVGSD